MVTWVVAKGASIFCILSQHFAKMAEFQYDDDDERPATELNPDEEQDCGGDDSLASVGDVVVREELEEVVVEEDE
jgi:hypothetical protein